jgi:hypothetical protein
MEILQELNHSPLFSAKQIIRENEPPQTRKEREAGSSIVGKTSCENFSTEGPSLETRRVAKEKNFSFPDFYFEVILEKPGRIYSAFIPAV